MRKYLVIGNPIEHSLSPRLHNYWIKKNKIDAIYEKKLTNKNDLKTLCNDIRKGKIHGFNVTIPFKEEIGENIDILEDNALVSGSINTVYRKWNGKEFVAAGDNTDVYGFYQSLVHLKERFNSKHSTALILGAGGATRGIIVTLKMLGINEIAISNRTKEKAKKLLKKTSDINHVYDWCNEESKSQVPDIIINCTSLGLKKEDTIPLRFSKYEKSISSKSIIFYDLIYNPEKTNFLESAKQIGQETINGKMMFIYQAQKSFQIWHNILPEINKETIDLLND